MGADKLGFLGRVGTREDLIEDRRTCRICLAKCELSWEHVPPRSAFNGADRLLEFFFAGKSRSTVPRTFRANGGFRVRSLCASCNSGVCAPYASEYIKLSAQIANQGPDIPGALHTYFIDGINRRYVMKQIASMVLSVNQAPMATGLPEMRHFVMNRDARVMLPFRVFLFHVPNINGAGTISGYHGRVDVLREAKGHEFAGGEISGFPIGVVYANEIGSEIIGQGLLDISSWALLDRRDAMAPQTLVLRTLITATDTVKGILQGRNGRAQVMFTDGH